MLKSSKNFRRMNLFSFIAFYTYLPIVHIVSFLWRSKDVFKDMLTLEGNSCNNWVFRPEKSSPS